MNGRLWSKSEEWRLKKVYMDEGFQAAIHAFQRRTPGAVQSKLYRMGITVFTVEPRISRKEEAWIGTTEIALRLGTDPSNARRWVSKHPLAVKRNRYLTLPVSAVEAEVERRKALPAVPRYGYVNRTEAQRILGISDESIEGMIYKLVKRGVIRTHEYLPPGSRSKVAFYQEDMVNWRRGLKHR